jgi:GNAT superfamily N-acetyltransferase
MREGRAGGTPARAPFPAGMLTASLRPLSESDLDAARELLRDAVPVASHLVQLLSVVRSAATAPSAEQRGLVADVAGHPAAMAVYGEYAGAAGAGRLHLVVVAQRHRRRGLGALLIDRLGSELLASGARFILTELPDHRPALDDYFAFLRASDFFEESRVPDFFREGVGLVLMKRR